MQSNRNHVFSQVPSVEIPRSSFNRTHSYKTTFNAGDLIPIFVDEVLPGDSFHLRATSFCRLATPIVPFMDNLYLDTFYFFVPYRLIWTHFVNFMGEQANPGDSISYTVPVMTVPGGGYTTGSLADYFGIPVGVSGGGFTHSTLPFRAYHKIWNDWFRDENLQNSAHLDVDDGPDTDTNYVVQKRGKRHDYFTSCLPWTQKGTAVTLPLGTSAPVLGIGKKTQVFPEGAVTVYESDGTTTNYAQSALISPSNNDNQFSVQGTAASGGYPNIYTDLSAATSANINLIRQAFQIQRLLERDARGGTRYIELVLSHFGVRSPDARLQRSELLGMDSNLWHINPVAQTSATDTNTSSQSPLGTLSAFGTQVGRGSGFTKSFVEHGVVIGLASVRADLNYQQGLNRMWSRSTRYDFYWPAFAHLGEQAVLNKEIYAVGSASGATDAGVFGYQERYGEMRYKPSVITGLFRSTATSGTPLDMWHLAQKFTSLPTLGSSFIVENPPLDRVSAVATPGTHFAQMYLDVHFSLVCARPMPTYGVPGMIDHL